MTVQVSEVVAPTGFCGGFCVAPVGVRGQPRSACWSATRWSRFPSSACDVSAHTDDTPTVSDFESDADHCRHLRLPSLFGGHHRSDDAVIRLVRQASCAAGSTGPSLSAPPDHGLTCWCRLLRPVHAPLRTPSTWSKTHTVVVAAPSHGRRRSVNDDVVVVVVLLVGNHGGDVGAGAVETDDTERLNLMWCDHNEAVPPATPTTQKLWKSFLLSLTMTMMTGSEKRNHVSLLLRTMTGGGGGGSGGLVASKFAGTRGSSNTSAQGTAVYGLPKQMVGKVKRHGFFFRHNIEQGGMV